MSNSNQPDKNKDVAQPKDNERDSAESSDSQDTTSFEANLKLADDSESSIDSNETDSSSESGDQSSQDSENGDSSIELTEEQLNEINSRDPETKALRDFLARVRDSKPDGLEADLKPEGGKLRQTAQLDSGNGRVFEHTSQHESYGEIKQTQYVSGENQGKVVTSFENHPQIQSIEFDTNNPDKPPVISFREGQDQSEFEIPSVISGKDADGQSWNIRADGSLERQLNGEPSRVIQFTPFDGAGRVDSKEFSQRLETRFNDRFEIEYKSPQEEDGLTKIVEHNDGRILRSFGERDDGLVSEEIQADNGGRTKTKAYTGRADGLTSQKDFIGPDSSSSQTTYEGRDDGLSSQLVTRLSGGSETTRRNFQGREDGLVSEVVNEDGSYTRSYSDNPDGSLTRIENVSASEVQEEARERELESSNFKEQIEGLSSNNPQVRSDALEELISNAQNWSQSDTKLITDSMSPQLLDALTRLNPDSLGENRATVVDSLAKYANPEAASVNQESHELGVRALANLAGSEKLEELGLNVEIQDGKFKAVSKNGTEFNFSQMEDGTNRLSSIRNRPDGGVFVNHFDDQGELEKSYEEVFDGDKRTTFMRDRDGNITEVQRPDGSEVNITYKNGVPVRLSDEHGFELTSEDGMQWKHGFESGTITGDLEVNRDGDISIVGDQNELHLGADASVIKVDKESGLTTRVEQNGVSISTNQSGQIVATTDRLGRNSSYDYDGDGSLVSYKDASGEWTRQEDGSWNNSSTGLSDGKTREVDESGRLRITNPDQTSTVYQLDGSTLSIDAQSRITEVKANNGLRTRFEYEGDDSRPSSVRYGDNDSKWVATNEDKTEWKKLEKQGDSFVDTGITWSGTIGVSERGHRETSARTGNTVERNSDGSRFERDRNNNITELKTASGDKYEFRYSDSGHLRGVTRPDGTNAGISDYRGWSSSDGNYMGGASVDQKTGRYRESGEGESAFTVDSDGTRVEYESYDSVTSIDLGEGRSLKLSRDDDGNLESSIDTRTLGTSQEIQFDGSRVNESEDGSIQTYGENGLLTSVTRSDGSSVSVERSEDGSIESLTDTRSTIRFERKEDGSFERVGSNPPDRIPDAEAFVNADGTFGFRNSEREILRSDSGFRITTEGGQTELNDQGSVVIRNSEGEVVSATTATGVSWEARRSTLDNGQTQIDQVRLGDKVWSREEGQSSWQSNDGQKFEGEINVNEDGSLSFSDSETGFETLRNLDGSTLFRDSQDRVHRVVKPDGSATNYGYSTNGELVRVERPDGSTYNRIANRKVRGGEVERWVENGTTNVEEGRRVVDSEGNLTITDRSGDVRIEQPDGWTKNIPEEGDVTYTREDPNGSKVTKNEQEQIVSSRHADGKTFEFGYDSQGNRNSVKTGNKTYRLSEDGNTWVTGSGEDARTWRGEALVTENGSVVWKAETSSGGTFETIYKSDGSRLEAQDGRITSIQAPGSSALEIGYDEEGKPNRINDGAQDGSYWKTEDGETWSKYNSDNQLDQSAESRSFKLDIGSNGTVRRTYGNAEPPYTELVRTDGSRLSFDAQGRKLNETKLESFESHRPQYSETEYKYDANDNLESFTTTMPDGMSVERDNLGRITSIRSGQLETTRGRRRNSETREFEYDGDSRVPTAYTRDGKRFELDRQAFENGRHIYKTAPDSRGNRTMIVGQLEARDDGSVEVSRGDGSKIFERIDGSTLTQLADGSSLDHRYDGFLTQRLRADGIRESFEYDLSSSDHVLKRRNQLSSVTKEFPSGSVETWKTNNGFTWRNQQNGEYWRGFTHVNHDTGDRVERYRDGETRQVGLDGDVDVLRSVGIADRVEAIEETFDYWYSSNVIEDVRSQLQDLDAEETYLARYHYDSNHDDNLIAAVREAVGGGGSSNHRWTEAEGYLRRTESQAFRGGAGMQGENYAIQLEVDAKEIDRWWWNRDRSKSEILTSTRRILGSASESERLKIDAAHSRMYGESLTSFYGEDGAGHRIASWDSYHEKLLSVSTRYGVDERTPEMQTEIMNAALSSSYGSRDEYFSEAAGKGFATDEGREHFRDNGGLSRIRSAFTQTHYTREGSYTTTDESKVTEMTDFANRGELRPITEFRKAFGVFSNDAKAMEHALSRLTDEERATLADGKQLFDQGTIPTTEGQQEALDYYKSWHKAFRDAHWFSEEARATGYEDQALREGGTDINESVAPIGTHWTNSHEINATAIEDMSQESFNLLMQGINLDSDAPTSAYFEQMSQALLANLGDGDYIDRANILLQDKMKHAGKVIEAADTGNLSDLKELVPAFTEMPEESWDSLASGYELEKQISSGTLDESTLDADQTKSLQAYRGDNELRTFMEGREIASHLHDIDSGKSLEDYKSGSELSEKIESGEIDEANLTEEQRHQLDTYNEYHEALKDNDLTLLNSVVLEQREQFERNQGESARSQLEGYQKLLYESTKENVRRDVLTALEDNDHLFSDDRSAMLDAVANMTPAERERYRKDTDGYRERLEDALAENLGGEGSIAYKAADALLSQIRNDENADNPGRPSENLGYQLLKLKVDGEYDPRTAANLVRDAIGKNPELRDELINDQSFREQAISALGSERQFDKLVSPQLEEGRLPVSTLVDLNTRIESDGEGNTYEVFEHKEFFKDAVLDASPEQLQFLASEEGQEYKAELLSHMRPQAKEIFEAVLENARSRASLTIEGEDANTGPRIDPEDRIRAFVVGAGVTKDEVRDLLGSLSESERIMAVQGYSLKYGSQMRDDLFDEISSNERDEFQYLTRGAEWTTEQSHLHNIGIVASTDSGIGADLSRNWNVMHRMALDNFEFEKWQAEGNLEPEKLRELNEAVQSAVDAFIETKDATADTVVTGIITAGAIGASFFTGGTSLAALYATGGVILGGGIVGAGTKYALMGNDHEGIRAIAGDFVKYSALTAANVIDPAHLGMVGQLGRKTAISATENAFANVAIRGVSGEVKEQVSKGMMQLVRDGISYGGGVADDAIVKMVGKINGLDDVAKAQLSRALQVSLRESVETTARTGLKQVLHKAQAQAQSMGLITMAGAGGNVVGDIGHMLVTDGEIDASRLTTSAAMGGTFGFGFGGLFKLGGAGFSRLLSRGAPDAPSVHVGDGGADVQIVHANAPEGTVDVQVVQAGVPDNAPSVRTGQGTGGTGQTPGTSQVQTDFTPPGSGTIDVMPENIPPGLVDSQIVHAGSSDVRVDLPANQDLPSGSQIEDPDIIPFDINRPRTQRLDGDSPSMREAARLPSTEEISDGVYRPKIEVPDASEVDAIAQDVPALSRPVAEEFSSRISRLQEGFSEDLSSSLTRARELAPQVDNARVDLDNEIARLQSEGHSLDDIEEAMRRKKHPLNRESNLFESNQSWKKLAEEHADQTQKVNELAQARRDQLQNELNEFVRNHNLDNPDSPLPPVRVEVAQNMHASGGYAFGEGVMVVPKAELISGGGGDDLARVAFHELVHAQQDMDIVRSIVQRQTSDGSEIRLSDIKSAYKEATGQDITDAWINSIRQASSDSAPLNDSQLLRARNLATDVRSATPVASQSTELGNTARVLNSKLQDLQSKPGVTAVNELIRDLTDPNGGDQLVQRLFGDDGIPEYLEGVISSWKASPKNKHGLATGFQPSKDVAKELTRRFQGRLDSVNQEHKSLIDRYARSQLEREAYGLDSNVSRRTSSRGIDGTASDAPAIARPERTSDPVQFRQEEVDRLIDESNSFLYATDLKFGLAPGEKPKFADIVQGEIFKEARVMLDAPGLNGGPSLRDQGWELLQSQKFSAADQAGADYILVNKNTGAYHLIDATQRPDKVNNIIHRFVWNTDQVNTGMLNEKGLDMVRNKLQEIVNSPAPLNVVDSPLPSLRRPDILEDGMNDVKLWQQTLKGSSDEGVRNFANRDLQRVVNYYPHAIRRTTPEYHARASAFNEQTERSVQRAIHDYLGVSQTDSGLKIQSKPNRTPFSQRASSSDIGDVNVTHDQISMQLGQDKFDVRLTEDEIVRQFDKEFERVLREVSNLPPEVRSAAQDGLYELRRNLNHNDIRRMAAARLNRLDEATLTGAPQPQPLSRVRYSQEEVNALYNLSREWNEVREIADVSTLGTTVNDDVRDLLEGVSTNTDLTPADRRAAEELLGLYRNDNPDGIKRVHDYLDGKHDSPWRADLTPPPKESLAPSQSDPNALSSMNQATKIDIYEPEIPVPNDAIVRQLESTIPQLNREAADELVDLMDTWRKTQVDDFNAESLAVDRLHENVLENDIAYSELVRDLEGQGISSDDIRAASRDRNHPLNEEHSIYQYKRNLANSRQRHADAKLRLDQKLTRRVQSLQETVDRFTESRGLPNVELTSRSATGFGAEYASGEGVVRLTDSLLLEPGGSKSLSRIVFHELVHLQQDSLLIRKAVQDSGLAGQSLDANGLERVKAAYSEATGFNTRDLDDEFITQVANHYRDAEPLTPAQIERADLLASEARSYDFDVDEAVELGNTLRVLKTTARGLMRKDPQGVNKLFNRLDGPESNINLKRMFGDEEIPADIQAKFDEWKQLPKDEDGLAIGFDEGDIREAIGNHLVKRIVDINIENKALVDKYSANGLEQEAYGLDHLVSRAERERYGPDYHDEPSPRPKRNRPPLEERKENLARSLDDVSRPEANDAIPTDLARFNLDFGLDSDPVRLTGDVISLGRRAENDVRFVQGQVSGKHAEIYLDADNNPSIRNLSTSNYTFVNGQKVDGSQSIKPGDKIGLGFYRGNEFNGAEFVFADGALHEVTPVSKGLGQYQIVQGEKVISFDSNKVSLGRTDSLADMQFNGATVSGRHAEIEFTSEGPLLRDTGSRNGTYVNGEKVSEVILKPGDRVELSKGVEFTFGQKPTGKLEEYRLKFGEDNVFDVPEGLTSITIGRADDVEFRITRTIAGDDYDRVSRNHAQIRYEDGKIVIEDLGSRNGTYVNGVEIDEPTMLVPGDRVRLGRENNAEFVFDSGIAFRPDPDVKHKITGTNFNRGDQVRIDDARYLDVEAIAGGRDPDSGKLIVIINDGRQGRINMKDVDQIPEMRAVNVNGRTLYKDDYNVFYERSKWSDTDMLISRPDIRLIDESLVKEAYAPIDYRVGAHIENTQHQGQTGKVLAYTANDGDPVVRLLNKKRFKKFYEENGRLDSDTGSLYVGDEKLTPIDVEGQKLFHDSQGNVYGTDYSQDGTSAFIYKNHELQVWDRLSSAKAQLQPRFDDMVPQRIEMPRSFEELPNVDAPRSHNDNVLYANTEFYLNGEPMMVNGKPVTFDGGEIPVGRELLGIDFEGSGTFVSAEHGKFGWDQEKQLFYFDDHSRNGTYVRRANSDDFVRYNGTKENPKRVYLAPGDELRLGAVEGEKLHLSVPEGWTGKRLRDVESTYMTQVYFDGRQLEMDGNRLLVGRNYQVYGNNNPSDALNRRVARRHAELYYNQETKKFEITDMSGSQFDQDGAANVHQTVMVQDEGNGIYVRNRGVGEPRFYQNEMVTLGVNDKIHLGSPHGPELKLVTRVGDGLGDGRVSFQKDNLDRVVQRPDGSHTVSTFMGTKRMISPDGTVAEATMANGRHLRFKYDKSKKLEEIRLPDNSSVVKGENGSWVRRTTDGVEEPWWNGKIEVESDGSLRYRTTDNPPQYVIQRLDNTTETIDANGRVTYGDVDLDFEKQSLARYGDTLANPERKERFLGMMEQFESHAKEFGLSDNQIAQSYHQIRRLLQADDGAFLLMAERQKLAEQTLFQMAHPDKVSQGANNTCNVTTVEKRILHRHPQEFARLVADVATTGKYITADGTLVDMSRVPGALQPDYEARMLDRPYDWAGEDLHRDGRRTWASQIFETTAVGIKYARGGSVNGEFIGSGEIVMYQKNMAPSGQESEQLVKYGVDFDGKLTSKVLEQSPSISGSELKDINNQIIGKPERDFIIGGNYFPDAHGNNRYWHEYNFSDGGMQIAESADQLQSKLLTMQQEGNLPAIVVVHTGHQFFGSAGGGNNGGGHVMNIKSIQQDGSGNWTVSFTNQWGDSYNKTVPVETMFQIMNSPF